MDAEKAGVSNSALAGSVLGQATEVTVHSGNIASWNKLRRKGAMTTTDELVSGTEGAFKSWLGRQSEGESSPHVLIRNGGLTQMVGKEERGNHSFTIKVFLSQWNDSLLKTAVEKTLSELGISSMDTLIVAFPACAEEDLTLDNMKLVWQQVEQLSRDGVAQVVGVADLLRPQFEELHSWAAVKPAVDQINLAHCCTMPENLVEFAKQHGVSLTTHNDESEILPQPQLQSTLSSSLGGVVDPTHWRYSWVTRYSSVVRLRGIIAHKGYLVELERM